MIIRLVPPLLAWIRPISQIPLANPPEYRREFGVADQEGVVLRDDFAFGVHVVEIGVVVGGDHVERSPLPWRGQSQHFRQEIG